MNVSKDTVVTISYRLSDAEGNAIEESGEQSYLHGGYGNMLGPVEAALDGKPVGHEAVVVVEPEQGFGHYDEDLVRVEARDRLPNGLQVGMRLEARHEGDDPDAEPTILTVTQIEDDRVVLDGNHPLAGMTLHFELKVTDVRKATDEEIAHGHAHQGDGHEH